MSAAPNSQQQRALALVKQRGMVRLSEFTKAGITAAAISRMTANGLITRLGRGLYQLPNAALDANHMLAEAAKRVPKGTICLVSALAYHGLTDAVPSRIWMAIGPKDRRPHIAQPPLQFVRFGAAVLESGAEIHNIEGVNVRIYCPAKTIVDLFRYRRRAGLRYRRSTGLNIALEGLREALRQRKTTAAEIARFAEEAGIWKVVQPYLDAMTANA